MNAKERELINNCLISFKDKSAELYHELSKWVARNERVSIEGGLAKPLKTAGVLCSSLKI